MINEFPGGVRLSIAITHHPSRAARLPLLLERLNTPKALEVRVVTDDRGEPPSLEGLRYTFLQAAMPPETCTHLLVLQDDAVPCRDFALALSRAIRAKPWGALLPYCNNPQTEACLATERSWLALHGWGWGLGVCMPRALWLAFLDFNARAFLPGAQPFHDDSRVALFLAERGEPYWCTVPSLLQHGSEKGESLLGHNARVSKARHALGPDDSALRIDWKTGNKIVTTAGLRAMLKYHEKVLNPAYWEGKIP